MNADRRPCLRCGTTTKPFNKGQVYCRDCSSAFQKASYRKHKEYHLWRNQEMRALKLIVSGKTND